jgi:hypothetical protein
VGFWERALREFEFPVFEGKAAGKQPFDSPAAKDIVHDVGEVIRWRAALFRASDTEPEDRINQLIRDHIAAMRRYGDACRHLDAVKQPRELGSVGITARALVDIARSTKDGAATVVVARWLRGLQPELLGEAIAGRRAAASRAKGGRAGRGVPKRPHTALIHRIGEAAGWHFGSILGVLREDWESIAGQRPNLAVVDVDVDDATQRVTFVFDPDDVTGPRLPVTLSWKSLRRTIERARGRDEAGGDK